MPKVAVMGAGSWGTAFANICLDAETKPEVVIWARREEVATSIDRDHANPDYLGDIALNPALRATHDAEEALSGADAVVIAVPSHALRASLLSWRDAVPRNTITVSLIKGLELETHQRASQVIREVLDIPHSRCVVVSGPNLAKECARGMPGGTVAAGPETKIVSTVQALCHAPYFRVYTNPDVVGVELGGVVKNAIAIAAGIADGMDFGDNTKAMLITRGLAEMSRLGMAMGGNPLTFSGLAGMGDLVATCMSSQSRNRHVGEQLGKGRALDEIIAEMNMVAEGVKSSGALLAVAEEHDVDMPIVQGVVAVVQEKASCQDLLESLMSRRAKPEFHGMHPVSGIG